jgi:hypothetical protein
LAVLCEKPVLFLEIGGKLKLELISLLKGIEICGTKEKEIKHLDF